jgi:hypothetical protein
MGQGPVLESYTALGQGPVLGRGPIHVGQGPIHVGQGPVYLGEGPVLGQSPELV